MKTIGFIGLFLCAILGTNTLLAQKVGKGNKGKKGTGGNWTKSEYSGTRSTRDVTMAMYSKGFAWISGSPADNEKLSVGKTAQFFGFVAVRYESGRVAKRGELGRALHELASPAQREILLNAAKAEEPVMKEWWACRGKILRMLEHHLYTGQDYNLKELGALAREFGRLNAHIAFIEAKAFATVEDLLTPQQWQQLRAIRKAPALAAEKGHKSKKIWFSGLSRDLTAQFEDLYAKAFSWLTGTVKDNQTIPLGQPAQFFGFVSIRHKSGHAASRGRISKQFAELLDEPQRTLVTEGTKELWPHVQRFMAKRNELLVEMEKLRKAPNTFNPEQYRQIANDLGLIEIKCGMVEAGTYHKIRKSMTDEQTRKMMSVRAEYILDPETMEKLDGLQRGMAIHKLCAVCHSNPLIAPEIQTVFERPVASVRGYAYSQAMVQIADGGNRWTEDKLDHFLSSPTKAVPGTKMGFQGLLNKSDRTAIIQYLKNIKDVQPSVRP